MKVSKEKLAEMLKNNRFPLSAKYDPRWVLENEMGPHPLWLLEWLCEEMALKPDMRVLDMGCGKAITSIFLAKEFGVQVWANDLWIPANDNWKRIREAGVEDRVFPIHAEAHALPYADEFFDAIVSVDSYHYYGTDDIYLGYFVKFLKPGGQIAVACPGLERDAGPRAPDHLKTWVQKWSDPDQFFSFHTAQWWRDHWEKTGLVHVEKADNLANGGEVWLQFEEARNGGEIDMLREDQGRYLGFVRMIA
jgi:cyclopropane fatty-acyl-phospholipid synthase-like methyltransferase